MGVVLQLISIRRSVGTIFRRSVSSTCLSTFCPCLLLKLLLWLIPVIDVSTRITLIQPSNQTRIHVLSNINGLSASW